MGMGELRPSEWRARVLAAVRAEFRAGREIVRAASGSTRKLGPITLSGITVMDALVTVYMDRVTRSCWPSVAELARQTGLGQSTVRAATRALADLGWIRKSPRWRRVGSRTSRTSNLYVVTIPRRWRRNFSHSAKLQSTTQQRVMSREVMALRSVMSWGFRDALDRVVVRSLVAAQAPPSPEPAPPVPPEPQAAPRRRLPAPPGLGLMSEYTAVIWPGVGAEIRLLRSGAGSRLDRLRWRQEVTDHIVAGGIPGLAAFNRFSGGVIPA